MYLSVLLCHYIGTEVCVTKTCDDTHGYCAVVAGSEQCYCHNGYQLSTEDHFTCIGKSA